MWDFGKRPRNFTSESKHHHPRCCYKRSKRATSTCRWSQCSGISEDIRSCQSTFYSPLISIRRNHSDSCRITLRTNITYFIWIHVGLQHFLPVVSWSILIHANICNAHHYYRNAERWPAWSICRHATWTQTTGRPATKPVGGEHVLHSEAFSPMCSYNCVRCRGRIQEKLYPLAFDPEVMLKKIQNLEDNEIDKITLSGPSKEWPNTYTFTKCLAEHLLVNKVLGPAASYTFVFFYAQTFAWNVSLIITTILAWKAATGNLASIHHWVRLERTGRLSLALCCRCFRHASYINVKYNFEQVPGWVDSISAAGSLYAAASLGVLKFFPGNLTLVL